MSCALKVDGAPDRAASLGAPSSGVGLSGRGNVQRALPDTVRRPTCHGIPCAPLEPEKNLLSGYGAKTTLIGEYLLACAFGLLRQIRLGIR